MAEKKYGTKEKPKPKDKSVSPAKDAKKIPLAKMGTTIGNDKKKTKKDESVS